MQQTVLITGANGFLAQAVRASLPSDWRSVPLVRPGTSNLPDGSADGFDSVASTAAKLGQVHTVFHLAACIPPDYDLPNLDLLKANVDLVSDLVQAYPDARHVYASSVAVYGKPVQLPLTIDSPGHAVSRYGLSKLAGECVVRQAASHAVIRFASIIGPGMRAGSFIPAAVAGARTGCIRLRGEGTRKQNYVDVRDAARMCVTAATLGTSLIGHGIGERSYTNLEVATLLADMTGASVVKEGVDNSPSYEYSNDAFSVGMTHRTSLRDTLARMLAA